MKVPTRAKVTTCKQNQSCFIDEIRNVNEQVCHPHGMFSNNPPPQIFGESENWYSHGWLLFLLPLLGSQTGRSIYVAILWGSLKGDKDNKASRTPCLSKSPIIVWLPWQWVTEGLGAFFSCCQTGKEQLDSGAISPLVSGMTSCIDGGNKNQELWEEENKVMLAAWPSPVF